MCIHEASDLILMSEGGGREREGGKGKREKGKEEGRKEGTKEGRNE